MPGVAGVFRGIYGPEPDPPQRVLPLRDRLEVGRVDASSVAAQVVEVQSVWNRSNVILKGPTVRIDVARLNYCCLCGVKVAVATASNSAQPLDAARVRKRDLRCETFQFGAHVQITISSSTTRSVMGSPVMAPWYLFTMDSMPSSASSTVAMIPSNQRGSGVMRFTYIGIPPAYEM